MILDSITVILIIFLSTVLQKYYYIILNKIASLSYFTNKVFSFVIRFWVIIHELCHLFFWFLSWNKIKEINLFDKTWWKVIYETKDYIWNLSQNWFSFNYFFFLVLNQIWLFLTSIWPLFFWILISYLFFWIFFLDMDFSNIWNIFIFWIFLFFYSIFIPSFVLSFQDISIFLISKQSWFFSTIFWSIINISIFLWFILSFSSFLVDYFIYFWIIFLLMFIVQLIIFLVISIIIKLLKSKNF